MNQNFNVDLHETDDGHLVNLKELFIHFELNPEISKINGISERFWNQVVIDGLIGNNDRTMETGEFFRVATRENLLQYLIMVLLFILKKVLLR